MSPTTEMVTMRDGARLATHIHLPDGAGPFPVIFERTPYGREIASRSEVTAASPEVPASRAELAAYFAAHGYGVVYQDCRGRHGSEGRFTKYLSEGPDGFDSCRWLVEQSWCDGRIATMGLSYGGHTQAALGCLDPPGLKAQVIDSGGFADAWRGGWRQLGIWAAGFHETYSRAACVHMSSWFDPYPLTAAMNYTGLKRAGRGEQRLILGPWTHGDRSRSHFGDVEFGPDAPIDSWAGDWRAYRLRFFDHAVKGKPDGEPRARIFVMGGGSGRRSAEGRLEHGGRWIEAADWPPPGAVPTPYHLHADGRLAREAASVEGASVSFRFDPARPVPTIGGAMSSLEPVATAGPFDQVEAAEFFGSSPPYLPLSSRPDVLVFETPPLTAPLQIAGPVETELHVATDAPDTDFTAKLIDVHPPSADYPRGYAMLLTDGIMRLRYADDPEHPRLAKAGEARRIKVTLFPTANLFLPGHRVRLDISSSNFPKFDVNPNTGEPEGLARLSRIAVNTVLMDRAHPSRVTLPVLPL
jgi:predicted acyl esterase